MMDAKIEEKRSAAQASGLECVRARALKQREVRLAKTGDHSSECANLRSTVRQYRSLKNKTTDELPPEEAEALGIISRLWGGFQEFLGNR